MTAEEQMIVRWFIETPSERQQLKADDLALIEELHARGPRFELTPSKRSRLLCLASIHPPGKPIYCELLSALTQLMDSRTPEVFRARLDKALLLYFRLMRARTTEGMVGIIAHSMAEKMTYSIREELPKCKF